MLDEVAFRINLGCKISPGNLVAGSFGDENLHAIVAVSQTLDKLVVHTSSGSSFIQQLNNQDTQQASGVSTSSLNQYVVIKDVIKSLSVQYFNSWPTNDEDSSDVHTTGSLLFMNTGETSFTKHNPRVLNPSTRRGLLLVGCSRSLLVYDVTKQSNLLDFSINISVDALADDASGNLESLLTICGGQKRISALKIEPNFNQPISTCRADIFCEAKLDYCVKCIVRGQLYGHNLLICGSTEQGIFIHLLDLFDVDIQPSQLCIKQNVTVNCLCPVYTLVDDAKESDSTDQVAEGQLNGLRSLPPLLEDDGSKEDYFKNFHSTSEQMNYFAYGLENGVIGVYYLFFSLEVDKTSPKPPALLSESLWRQRCKQVPISMQMYDMNGDGCEELVIGYRNGRLDVRSPFTGQLLATTKCFRQYSDRLAGLTVIDYYGNGKLALIACSTSGHINGYMPRYVKPRVPLRAHNLAKNGIQLPSPTFVNLNHQLANNEEEPVTNDDSNPFNLGLQIESGRSDNVRPQASDAKQNLDYLLQINSLLTERMQLEEKACQLYRKRFADEFKLLTDEVLGHHRWDFDYVTARLKLTIVVGVNRQGLKASFIRLLDETRNFLKTGYLLIDMDATANHETTKRSSETKSQVVVIPLRSTMDNPDTTELKLSIFFPSSALEAGDCVEQMVQVFTKSIHVPQYAMLVLDPRENHEFSWAPEIRLNCKLVHGIEAQQLLDWLREKLLCLQFGYLIGNYPNWQATVDTHANSVALDQNGGFKINLVDAREAAANNSNRRQDSIGQLAKSNYAGQALRIAYRKMDDGESDADELSGGHLSLECESSSSDSCLSLIRWFVIDRLRSAADSTSDGPPMELVVEMDSILGEITGLEEQARQLEESEKRLQSDLYELSQHTGSMMQQLCISNELNEFTTSRELLNELFIMLNEAQNAARAQTLTCGSRRKVDKRREELKEKVAAFLPD